MRLLGVELRRLRLRRLVAFAALVGLLGAAFLVFIASFDAAPVTEEDRQWAQEMYEQELVYWEEHGQEQVEQCLAAQEEESERTGEDLDFGCADMAPQLEWYLPYEPTLAEYLQGVIQPFTLVLLLLVGLLIGATVVAAEFGAGSMATLLTFEPRRWRVYAAKMSATGLGTVPLGLLVVAVVGVGTWALFSLRGLDHAVPEGLVWEGVRMLTLLPGAALVGAVLAFLLRSTGAVLGVAVGYAIAIELILRQALPGTSPWIPGVNLNGWVGYGTTYYTNECTRGESGLTCQMVEQQLSFGWSSTFLAVCLVLLVAVAGWAFSRRDVS